MKRETNSNYGRPNMRRREVILIELLLIFVLLTPLIVAIETVASCHIADFYLRAEIY